MRTAVVCHLAYPGKVSTTMKIVMSSYVFEMICRLCAMDMLDYGMRQAYYPQQHQRQGRQF